MRLNFSSHLSFFFPPVTFDLERFVFVIGINIHLFIGQTYNCILYYIQNFKQFFISKKILCVLANISTIYDFRI